jgi:hypothetical protein
LQHIDFSLPRKHKPALFIVIETAPLTTIAAPLRRMLRRGAQRRASALLVDHLIKIFRNRLAID